MRNSSLGNIHTIHESSVYTHFLNSSPHTIPAQLHNFLILDDNSLYTRSNRQTSHIKQILLVLLHNIDIVLVLVSLFVVLERLVPEIRDAVVRHCTLALARFLCRGLELMRGYFGG
jgi:hypothetical protein